MDKQQKIPSTSKIVISIAIFITIFIIAGKYDADINKENAISDSTILSDKKSFLSDTNFINVIYSNLTKGQIAELIYNTDRENWDTVSKAELICTYFTNTEYYDSVPSTYNPEWIYSVIITE